MESTYGGPQLSRQNKKHHGKTKSATAKQKAPRQNEKSHGKTKSATACKTQRATAKRKEPKSMRVKGRKGVAVIHGIGYKLSARAVCS